MANPALAEIQLRALLGQAQALRQAGRLADSIAPMQKAAALAPRHAPIQHDLGVTLITCGRAVDAIAPLRRAVAADPRFAQAHWRLGTALEMAGDSASALAAFERACALEPKLAFAQFRRAVLVAQEGRTTEAVEAFRLAAAAAPDPGFRLRSEARALLIEGDNAAVERVLREWQAISPDDPDMNELLGTVLCDAGRFEEADPLLEKVLAADPRRTGTFYELLRGRRVGQADRGIIDRMEAAALQPNLGPIRLGRLHLAIAKAYDDLGEYEAAMMACDRAYEARRIIQRADPIAFEASLAQIAQRYDAEAMRAAPALGTPDATPVLIVGLPRSGTTLMEQIISAHPQAAGGGELPYWPGRGDPHEAAKGKVRDTAFLRDCAGGHLQLLRRLAPDAMRVTDKNPFNFIWAGLIHLAMPNATIVHCRRQAIDTALSIHQTGAGPPAFPTGGPELVSYMRAYDRLMAHWRAVLPADRFLEVDYEALTADPEPVIRRIIAFCGLPWDNACLRPELNPRSVNTPSKWQVRQPIGRGSVDNWKRYEPWLGPLAELKPGP